LTSPKRAGKATAVNSQLDEAYRLASEQQWGSAARAFTSVAAASTGDVSLTAWEGAGEAHRRDDSPLSAVTALGSALELVTEPKRRAILQVKLAGTHTELGQGQRALSLCIQAAEEPDCEALAVDTMSGLVQTWGARAALADLVQRLSVLDKTGLAYRFRQAQLHRLNGQLDNSRAGFEALTSDLSALPGATVAVAATKAELASVALLQGRFEDAIGAYEAGLLEHEAAGRRTLAWRCESGRVHSLVAVGSRPLAGRLNAGIQFADQRGLVVLGVDLRIARGLATSSGDTAMAAADLRFARETSTALGMAFRAGRAGLAWVERCSGPTDILSRCVQELAISAPWQARARALRAQRTGDHMSLRESLVAFKNMGMEADVKAARATIG
jgi:hypothetical protein